MLSLQIVGENSADWSCIEVFVAQGKRCVAGIDQTTGTLYVTTEPETPELTTEGVAPDSDTRTQGVLRALLLSMSWADRQTAKLRLSEEERQWLSQVMEGDINW